MTAMFSLGTAGIVGLVIGFVLAKLMSKGTKDAAPDASGADVEWWKV